MTSGMVPEWLVSAFALTTIFTVMLDIGLGVVPGEFLWLWRNPGLMLKSLFAVLIAVPAMAFVLARVAGLPHAAEVGVMVMAISPGAPVALRRSLRAGGHAAFAPGLQVAIATLAVVSMPLSIAALDEVYGASASVSPAQLARQVFIAQLLPLGLGVAARQWWPGSAAWLEPVLRRLCGVLLVAFAGLAVLAFWSALLLAGLRVACAAVLVTLAALAMGHTLGGPEPATRTAVAISSAVRNPGLALLVVAVNGAPAAVKITVLSYMIASGLTVLPYVMWRRRQIP